jgi:uncharacterized membrane protein YfcA
MQELAWLAAALAGAGLLAGFVGGLFGIGGGAVLVPVLYLLFGALGVDDSVRMHLAIGTSLSTIMVTSWRSFSAHLKADAVDFEVVRAWGPWIAGGAVAGAALAGAVETRMLLGVFGVGLCAVAAQLAFAGPLWRLADAAPLGLSGGVIAGSIGFLSAMMGIGGDAFGATALTLCGTPIHRAVGTASGFGALIALPATLGFIVTGWEHPELPAWSIGYVSAPGFAIVGLLTAATAPIGARLAHRLPALALKRTFAVFLALVALNMVRAAFS